MKEELLILVLMKCIVYKVMVFEWDNVYLLKLCGRCILVWLFFLDKDKLLLELLWLVVIWINDFLYIYYVIYVYLCL